MITEFMPILRAYFCTKPNNIGAKNQKKKGGMFVMKIFAKYISKRVATPRTKIKPIYKLVNNKKFTMVVSNNEEFRDCLQKGKQGEIVFKGWCDKEGWKYIDVTDIEEYQDIDVDFITTDKKNNQGYVEVKTQAKVKKGELYIELTTDTGGIGWWYKSKANLFAFYGGYPSNKMYLIKAKLLKEYIANSTLNKINGRCGQAYIVGITKLKKYAKENGINGIFEVNVTPPPQTSRKDNRMAIATHKISLVTILLPTQQKYKPRL